MSRRSVVTRECIVTVELDEDEAPDMKIRYGKTVFAPQRLHLHWYARPGADWQLHNVKTTGGRRLKDGAVSGQSGGDYQWYHRDEMPAWVEAIVAVNRPNPVDPNELPVVEVSPTDLDGGAS
jgi:hypothetical protein